MMAGPGPATSGAGSGDFYDAPTVEYLTRGLSTHLHPGAVEETVALAERAGRYGFPMGGRLLEVGSALGGPARFVARKFAATVLCLDADPRMHAHATRVARSEGIGARCPGIVALAERVPVAGGALDGAWSQDAICHMDERAVIPELARVIKSGGMLAFTDWIARDGWTDDDLATVSSLWGFPSLLRLAEYTALLDASGFEVLLAEDRTPANAARRRERPADQDAWERAFAERHGEDELERQRRPNLAWSALVEAGHAGHGLFIAARRAG